MGITPDDFDASLKDEASVTEAIRNGGPGFLSDLIKMGERDGTPVDLTGVEARDSGAGFAQDVLRTTEVPPFSTAVVNITNDVEAIVTVDAADYQQFPVGSTVKFSDTGNAMLDAPQADFYVLSVDDQVKTFTINADLSAETAPITQGTITKGT